MKTHVILSLALASALSVAAVGCGGGGHHGGGGGGSDASSPLSATTQGTSAATALAVQATLAVINTATFRPLQGASPTVTKSGTSMQGTVTIDFGASTVVNNATWSGAIVTSYTMTALSGSGGSGAVSVDFTNFSFTTNTLGRTTVAGTLLLKSFSFSGSSSVAATSLSQLTLTSAARGTFTLSPTAFAWDFSNFTSPGTERQRYTEDLVSAGSIGNWDVQLVSIEQTLGASGIRQLTNGTATITQIGNSASGSIFSFEDAPNGGIRINSPSGTIGPFNL